MIRRILWSFIFVYLVLVIGCRTKQDSYPAAEISVTNTYLQSAIRDLCGATEVFCLAPPGMCPGHFDLSPEQIRSLLDSKILFRFDFQAGLDEKLNRINGPIISITGRSGMCIPQTYLEACREIVPFLEKHVPGRSQDCQENYRHLERRLAEISDRIHIRVKESDMLGVSVIASHHQADFVRWLGLEVVATFRSAEVMTPSEIESCLRLAREKEVQIVIANAQEGTELPRNIAQHLNGRLVVFSNFPDTIEYHENAFEQLLEFNLDQLLAQHM
ncbi:MAG: zinc ABC transporter substrate-binding protein [Sedimentisphaerales bacterium]|nr:zinc ABC transporter substrate-binding protein [Sedimentisphaerales bacterium]